MNKLGLIVSGRQLEQWLLKTLFNFSLSNVAATGWDQFNTQMPGRRFVEYVFDSKDDLPPEAGLFLIHYEHPDGAVGTGSQLFRTLSGQVTRDGVVVGRRVSALTYDCGIGAIPLLFNADCLLSKTETIVKALNNSDGKTPKVLNVSRRPHAIQLDYAGVLRTVVFDWDDGEYPEEFHLIRHARHRK